ncbi:folate-Biopterin Transporter (FBT) family [Thraustotheca clavata]|uniref:Folate-Biopterin Transporter (FBT) family n=1 Tax=Thraustotheca clavata TaxID=74557 RepID=A0A1W0AC11_9STRA|nr:folate-Biopterin Transporter (FBT) family [Thraustotheca clavata]
MISTTDPSVDAPFESTEASEVPFKSAEEFDAATAIAPGGAVPLKSRPGITLYVQSIISNFLQNALPPLNTYIFTVYLHGSALNVAQLNSLNTIAWSLRVIFGMLSDYAQLFGYRRKVWLIVGWLLALGGVASIAFSSFGSPFCDPKEYPTCLNPKVNTTIKAYDLSASSRVAWYRTPTFFTTLGAVMVQANLDGIVVEYAHREPIGIRGRIQAFTFFISGIGILLSRFFLLFCMSAKRYGGTYDWSAGPNVPYIIAFALVLVGLFLAIVLFQDTLNHIKSFKEWVEKLWLLLQNRAVYQLLAFRFSTNLLQSLTGTSVLTWVRNLDLQWANVIPRIPYVPTMIITMRLGTNWNWRKSILIFTSLSILVTSIATFCVIWDACRNCYFYIILIASTAIATALNTLMPAWAMVEVAGIGHEATIAAIYNTIKDLNVPITTKWRNYIIESFPSIPLLLNDRHNQNQVGYTWLISLGVQIVGLAFIFLIPTQRIPILNMKENSGQSILAGCIVIAGYIALFVFDWQQSLQNY